MSLQRSLALYIVFQINRLTAVDAYMRKSEVLRKTNHKKSTVRAKIPKTMLKRSQLIVLIKSEVHAQKVTKVTMTSKFTLKMANRLNYELVMERLFDDGFKL